MHLARWSSRLFAGICVVSLLACGGSGGDDGPSVTPRTCNNTTYAPNYAATIVQGSDPAIRGELRYWTRTPIRVWFVRDASFSDALESRFREAMAQWTGAISNGITFVDAANISDADFTVRFRPGSELPPGAIGIAYTFFIAEKRPAIGRVDLEIANDLATPTVTRTTCAHEIGHALGLGGHSPNDADIMFFRENGTAAPTERDINTLRTAYCDLFPQDLPRTRSRQLGDVDVIVCPR